MVRNDHTRVISHLLEDLLSFQVHADADGPRDEHLELLGQRVRVRTSVSGNSSSEGAKVELLVQ